MSIWRLPVLESRSAAAESGTTVQARLPVPHSKLKDINHAPDIKPKYVRLSSLTRNQNRVRLESLTYLIFWRVAELETCATSVGKRKWNLLTRYSTPL